MASAYGTAAHAAGGGRVSAHLRAANNMVEATRWSMAIHPPPPPTTTTTTQPPLTPLPLPSGATRHHRRGQKGLG